MYGSRARQPSAKSHAFQDIVNHVAEESTAQPELVLRTLDFIAEAGRLRQCA